MRRDRYALRQLRRCCWSDGPTFIDQGVAEAKGLIFMMRYIPLDYAAHMADVFARLIAYWRGVLVLSRSEFTITGISYGLWIPILLVTAATID